MAEPVYSDTNFGQLLYDAHQKVLGITFAVGAGELADASKQIRKVPWDLNLPTPNLIVSPVPETVQGGTNGEDDVVYGVMVTLVTKTNRDPVLHIYRELKWREQIRQAFHNKIDWTTTTGIVICTVEPGEALIPEAFRINYDAQYLLLRCQVREVRT